MFRKLTPPLFFLTQGSSGLRTKASLPRSPSSTLALLAPSAPSTFRPPPSTTSLTVSRARYPLLVGLVLTLFSSLTQRRRAASRLSGASSEPETGFSLAPSLSLAFRHASSSRSSWLDQGNGAYTQVSLVETHSFNTQSLTHTQAPFPNHSSLYSL